MYNYIGNYRAHEEEVLDLKNADTEAWMKKHFPAVMANRPVGMSHDYQFMPTHQMIRQMTDKYDLRLVEIGQQRSRARDPSGQEHFVKFRLPSTYNFKKVGDSVPELVIMNSHNGRMTARAYAGIFRMVCMNGMVISEKSFGQIRLRHFGEDNNFANFSGTLDTMARRLNVFDARISKMDSVLLNRGEQVRLARFIMKQRGAPSWLQPEMVLEPHRPEDEARKDGLRSLWITFNVCQENLTAKAIERARTGQRPQSMRPINGARSHILTNEKIWQGLELFVDKHMSHLTEELMDQPELAIEEPKAAPRSAKDILQLATYGELCDVTDEEREAMTANERKKLSSRKSYLKRRENA